MDFISLSPSDDDLFRQSQDHHSSEADNFPITSVPETPIPVAQEPSRKRASLKSNSISLIGSHPAWFTSPKHPRLPKFTRLLLRVSQPTSLRSKERTRKFQNRESLMLQLTNCFAPERRSLLPSFRWNTG